jgi:hypothetical protein
MMREDLDLDLDPNLRAQLLLLQRYRRLDRRVIQARTARRDRHCIDQTLPANGRSARDSTPVAAIVASTNKSGAAATHARRRRPGPASRMRNAAAQDGSHDAMAATALASAIASCADQTVPLREKMYQPAA